MANEHPRSPPTRISLVLSDVDGTLVTTDKKLTEEARAAVSALREKKICFALASSRPPFGLRSVVEALDFDGPVASFNGGLISRHDGVELESHWVPRSIAAEVIQFFGEWGFDVWAFTSDRWLCQNENGPYVAHERLTVSSPPTVVASFDADLGRLGKIVAVSTDHGRLAQCEVAARDRFRGKAQVARSQAYYLDVTHLRADKGDALIAMARAVGVPLEECVALGDGANDIPMLRTAAYGVAMGNGVEDLRNIADFVSTANDDQGFAGAIRHIFGVHPMTSLQVDIARDPDEAARRAAECLCGAVLRVGAVGAVCLAGGETPRRMYAYLTDEPIRSRFPWARTHWFIGDERFVPPDDERSNYRMIEECLALAPIPKTNLHAIETQGVDPEQSASLYQSELEAFYASNVLVAAKPLFDFVVLGLGTDGHTASLFPGRSEQNERDRWVLAVPGGAPEPRITLTPPALQSAHVVGFLAVGETKRDAFAKLRAGDASIPAARIRSQGSLLAFVDVAAAA